MTLPPHHPQHGHAAAYFFGEKIDQRLRRHEIRRFDDNRFLRGGNDVVEPHANARTSFRRERIVKEMDRGDVGLTF